MLSQFRQQSATRIPVHSPLSKDPARAKFQVRTWNTNGPDCRMLHFLYHVVVENLKPKKSSEELSFTDVS